ncbi:MAG: type II toxin-antitoxin system HicB family antitoxin [Rhizobiaceae bacterium]|nr:type II toxin-antitoxin system HicB family antitoxin [Rhizobiaceae bacterium]
MTSTLTYKTYSARIEFDADDEIFFGKIAGIRDVVGFHADTVTELKDAFYEAVDDYVATCAEIGKDPQKPYSGKLMLRISPDTHASVALAAELAGKSITKWAEEALGNAAAS